MKQFAAVTFVALIVAVSSPAQMNLKGITASNKVGAFSNSRDLLPTPAPALAPANRGSGLQSNKSILSGPSVIHADPSHAKGPVCPEPASLAALAIGFGTMIRRRKAARG